MDDKDLLQLLSKLRLGENISLQEIPSLDLYMDQVIQLFENKFNNTLRNEKDKVLTKTMINNYSKDKLFMQGKNKKYSKEHLILLSLIYQLKGGLSINDIKNAIYPIVKTFDEGKEYPLEELYLAYLKLYEENVNIFAGEVQGRLEYVNSMVSEGKDLGGEYEGRLLMLFSLITMSNLYRKTAEKLLDDFIVK